MTTTAILTPLTHWLTHADHQAILATTLAVRASFILLAVVGVGLSLHVGRDAQRDLDVRKRAGLNGTLEKAGKIAITNSLEVALPLHLGFLALAALTSFAALPSPAALPRVSATYLLFTAIQSIVIRGQIRVVRWRHQVRHPDPTPEEEPMPEPVHIEREDHGWAIDIPDHPQRADSPEFRASKRTVHLILGTLDEQPYGPGPWQMHHGGSLWTYDGHRWFLVLSTIGIEWSAQWCADPAKVDLLRQLAALHYAGFPSTVPALEALGYREAPELLETPITDAAGVARWVDSLFNSCVPLAAGVHTGVLSDQSPVGGIHHYPKPVADIQFVKRDDFTLWVVDPVSGSRIAVVPHGPRGSGDGRVEVVHAEPGSEMHLRHRAAHAAGERLVLGADHPLARAAFARQG